MHPLVRGLVLVLLAQILRACGDRLGFELSPATDNFRMIDGLQDLLSLPSLSSSGHVVSLDLETVGVHLGAIPIDEILGFRKEHFKEHRAYVRAARRFAQDISLLSQQDHTVALMDRRSELRDLAADLKNYSRRAWKRPAYFGLTMVGAAIVWKTTGPLEAIWEQAQHF
jgi:hypothetical protein